MGSKALAVIHASGSVLGLLARAPAGLAGMWMARARYRSALAQELEAAGMPREAALEIAREGDLLSSIWEQIKQKE